nr:MAG TPA: hypothetical protein [Caudoviricetes sp.]
MILVHIVNDCIVAYLHKLLCALFFVLFPNK